MAKILVAPLKKGGCHENGDRFCGDVRSLGRLLSGHGLAVYEDPGAGLFLLVPLKVTRIRLSIFLLTKRYIMVLDKIALTMKYLKIAPTGCWNSN